MFEAVELLARDGGLVYEGEMPVFNPRPEVVIWGARVFVRRESGEYREGFAYYILPSQPQQGT